MKTPKLESGFGLVEVMIGVAIASLMTIAVVTVYITQSATFAKQTSRNSAAEDAWNAFYLLDTLFKHAESNGFTVEYGATGARNIGNPPPIELLDAVGVVGEDEITVTFQIPLGMNIWPNDVDPYDRNQMRLKWSNYGDNKYQITLATSDGTGFGGETVLAGGDGGGNSKVINLDFWPLDANGVPRANATDYANGGYQITLSTRAGQKAGESDPVFTVSSVVLPRNWL